MHADSTLNTIAPWGLTAPTNTPPGEYRPGKQYRGTGQAGYKPGRGSSCRGRIRDTAYAEQEDHGGGTRITLAIHTEDGMGSGPQGAGSLLDMRAAD